MKRRRLLGSIGGATVTGLAGCSNPLDSSGSILAAVHGSNRDDDDHGVAVTVEMDGEVVADGTLDLARHRANGDTPTDELACTWPTDERATFTIVARLVERDETHERSTDDAAAPDDVCQNARITVDETDLTVSLWGCDSRSDAPPGFDCDDGDFDWA